MIDAEQIRMARAALGWNQGQLAKAADVALGTVKKAEVDVRSVTGRSLGSIVDALEAAGMVFLEHGDTRSGGKGVRRKD